MKVLVSQNVIPSTKNIGGHLPYAFTEHGVAMLSSVLKSRRAAEMNVQIIRTFIQLRHILAEHKNLAKRVLKIETLI